MTDESGYTTVYRSADTDAEMDASSVLNRLLNAGLNAEMVGDDAAGVVAGTYEVRVPASDAAHAEELIAQAPVEMPDVLDPSHEMDMVTVATMDGTTGEFEAMAVEGVLDASGIPNMVVGSTALPVLGFEVKVASEDVERAESAIAEAIAAGPEAALEGSQASELQQP